MCGTPHPGEQFSIMGVYNSTAFGEVLTREQNRFDKLFRRKAMLHHYLEYMSNDDVAAARETVASLLQDYADIEAGAFPKNVPKVDDLKLFPLF